MKKVLSVIMVMAILLTSSVSVFASDGTRFIKGTLTEDGRLYRFTEDGLDLIDTDVIDFSYCFYCCSQIKCIPVSLFDNNRKVVDFNGTFHSCYDVTGESPYTEINGVKYHLYERENAPDHFVKPNSMRYCFHGCGGLTDWESIPETWNYQNYFLLKSGPLR